MTGQKIYILNLTSNEDDDGTFVSHLYNSCILLLHFFTMNSEMIIDSGILYATCLQISIPRVEINF